MPHLEIERTRRTPILCDCCGERGRYKRSRQCQYIVEVCEIIAGILFIWGSIDFLPEYTKDVIILLHGCQLFIAGGVIYFSISAFCLSESIDEKGIASMESGENMFYVAGAAVFFVGTLLYWPFDLSNPEKAAELVASATIEGVGLPTYINNLSPQFHGTVLFIAGSMMFAFAAFMNGLHQRRFNDVKSQMLTAITSLYMLGSVLFVMGSVAFLPDLGCNDKMERFGAWCFIIGSSQYEAGGWISLFRTILEGGDEDEDGDEESYGAASKLRTAKLT